jgi:hypothetical protein
MMLVILDSYVLMIHPFFVKNDRLRKIMKWTYWKESSLLMEEVNEGWWKGVGPGGKTGLFPCKSFVYVFFVS